MDKGALKTYLYLLIISSPSTEGEMFPIEFQVAAYADRSVAEERGRYLTTRLKQREDDMAALYCNSEATKEELNAGRSRIEAEYADVNDYRGGVQDQSAKFRVEAIEAYL